MRSLAAYLAERRFDVVAVSEISPGDALSLSTRFALQWAYRGGQALFWTDIFEHATCREVYLPVNVTRPFERRAFLRVDAEVRQTPLTLAVSRLSPDRRARLTEMRFIRESLRETSNDAVLFVASPGNADALPAIGLTEWTPSEANALRLLARGLRIDGLRAFSETFYDVAEAHATPART